MRSETPPIWTAFLIALGIMLLVAAVMTIATGKLKLTRNSTVTREDDPGVFWAWVGGMFVVALVSIVIATPHFRPGG